jgi:elongation factor Ts
MRLPFILFLGVLVSVSAFSPVPSLGAKRTTVFTPTNLFMGDVTPKTIKELRDTTGAGMMDCKKALLEADGDQEAAAEYLRKKGLVKADKKASRVAAEGKIAVKSDGSKAVMVEVNCETDFVAKDDNFLGFCEKVAGAAVSLDDDSIEGLMSKEVDGELLEETRKALVAKIGENIQVRRIASGGGDGKTVG